MMSDISGTTVKTVEISCKAGTASVKYLITDDNVYFTCTKGTIPKNKIAQITVDKICQIEAGIKWNKKTWFEIPSPSYRQNEFGDLSIVFCEHRKHRIGSYEAIMAPKEIREKLLE